MCFGGTRFPAQFFGLQGREETPLEAPISAARVARRGQGSFAKGVARRGISQHEGVLYQEPPKAVAALTKLTQYSKGFVAQDGQ